MKTSLLNRLLGMIFSLAALAAMTLDSCANPAIGFIAPTAVASAHSLTLAWNSAEGYKSLRPTFPTPTSYDITLHPTTGPDVTQTAVATTSCTFANLAAVIYTATVNGKIGSNVVVTGTGSVNMTGAAAVTSTILLYYISSGAGTGQMHLTFSSATAVTGTPTLTLVDPAGVITNPTPTGTTPTFAHQNTSAVAGTWKMFSKFIAGTTTALKSDTILVLQGVDTIATVSIAASDFNATYIPVTSLTLSASTMSLNAGGATGSLTATLVPASPSNSLVAWTSTAPFTANVDQNGVVTPVAAGTATITATSVDTSTIKASCTVTVSATYSVTYDVNNANSGSAPVIQTKIAGTSLTLATNSGTLARTGYSFAGWNTLATGLGTDYAAGASYALEAALYLYAKWTALSTYSVTYSANSATSGTAPGTQTKTQGTDLSLATNSGSLVRTGYTFAGWNTAAGGGGTDYIVGATYSTDATLALFAKWTPLPTYSVTYLGNSNTGGAVPSSQTKTQGTSLTLATNTAGALVRTGYTFAGWNTAAVGNGTAYAEGAPYTIDTALTLYAAWTASESTGYSNIITPASRTVSISGPATMHFGISSTFTSGYYGGSASGYAWYMDANTTIRSSASTLTFIPVVGADAYGSHTLMLVVTDADGISYSTTFLISVLN